MQLGAFFHDYGALVAPVAAIINGFIAVDEVLVSTTVRDLVAGSGLRFESRGAHTLKGVPGDWHLLAAT
jgi:class 3 adenylate cyclase